MADTNKQNGGNLESMTVKEFFASKKTPSIIALCGSQRKGSYNQILLDHCVKELKEKHCAIVETVDLNALQLPLYNQDDEPGAFPANAKLFREKLIAADGILITSPEYNGFTSPLLLNAITWATRGEGDMYAGFKGKCCSVLATSPGNMGGMRMIRSLTQLLQDMGTTVVPGSNAIGGSYKVFKEDGTIQDERTRSKIEVACANLMHFCRYQANRETDCAIAQAFFANSVMASYGQTDE